MSALIVGSASQLNRDLASILSDHGHENIDTIEWDRNGSDPVCAASHRGQLLEKIGVSPCAAKPMDFFIYSHFESETEHREPFADTLLSHIACLAGNVGSFISIVSTMACASMPFMPATLNGSSGKVGKILVVGIAPVIDRPCMAHPGPRKYWKREDDGRMVLYVEEAPMPTSRMRTPMDVYWAAGMIIGWCEHDFRYKAVNIEWDPPKILVVEEF